MGPNTTQLHVTPLPTTPPGLPGDPETGVNGSTRVGRERRGCQVI